MLGINMNDVITTLRLIRGYLIALAVVLVLAVAVTVAAVKFKKPLKGLVRGSAWMAFIVALVIIVDMILTGPMYGIVGMALRGGGDISEESITEASTLCEDIADEGFVLLKNEDGLLPLGSGAKVNTFGWSATNPVYGGTGSGSLSGLYPTVTLLEGIKQAGIEYNEELTKFYTDWKDKRPNIGMMGQDWTCPEPTIAEYESAGVFDSAAAYSDVAMIVISRAGGEGADLPTTLDPAIEDTFQDDGSGTILAHDFGASIGKMANEMDVSGWYAPAMNIHRTSFSGRNFEYYSEDGFLSGSMASNAVNGAAESGVYSFIKHFALNDQETNRNNMLCTWSNEQAIREIYLKPFEMCVKNYEGKSIAVMSSFNYIGNKYAGANPELLNTVLRDEWGFRGMVLTDYFGGYGYQDADIQIRNGNDFCLTPQMTEFSELTDKTSGTSLQAARQACKNILYTAANSRAYADGAGGGMAGWEIAMYAISAVAILAAVAGEVMLVRSYKKKKNA